MRRGVSNTKYEPERHIGLTITVTQPEFCGHYTVSQYLRHRQLTTLSCLLHRTRVSISGEPQPMGIAQFVATKRVQKHTAVGIR